jgi:hypothetical protein
MFYLGLIVSICYLPGWSGASVPTQWAVLSMVLPFLARGGPWTPLHLLGLGFLGWAGALCFRGPVIYDEVYGYWILWIGALTLCLGSRLESLGPIIRGLGVGAAVSSAVGILNWFGWHPFPSFGPMPSGIYFNSIAQGEILALISVGLVIERQWLLALALLPGLALSESRGGALMLAFGLLACWRQWWTLGIFALPVAYFAFHPLSQSDDLRVRIWAIAFSGLTALGWGPGSFNAVYFPVPGGVMMHPEFVHNDYLQLAFEYGLMALAPILVLALSLTRISNPYWPIVVSIAIGATFSFPFFMPITAFLGLLAVGNALRDWALAWGLGDLRRLSFLQRLSRKESTCNPIRGQAISLVARTEE